MCCFLLDVVLILIPKTNASFFDKTSLKCQRGFPLPNQRQFFKNIFSSLFSKEKRLLLFFFKFKNNSTLYWPRESFQTPTLLWIYHFNFYCTRIFYLNLPSKNFNLIVSCSLKPSSKSLLLFGQETSRTNVHFLFFPKIDCQTFFILLLHF